MRITSGCSILDKLLKGGYEHGVISTIYGEAGSGKTNLALLACLNCAENEKVIFVDTEGGFSTERIKQLFPDHAERLKNVKIFEPTTFAEQRKAIEEIKALVEKDGAKLVVIDSIVMLYRLNLKGNDVSETNKELANQLGLLSELARKKNVAIIVTNQVYSEFDKKNSIKMVGGDLLKYWSKCILKLEKFSEGVRKASLVKHRSIAEGASVFLQICENEIKGVKEPKKKFSLF